VNKPSDSQYEVTISNAMGAVIETKRFDDNAIFNVSGYASGVYFCYSFATYPTKTEM
jgi:hypothetical protein